MFQNVHVDESKRASNDQNLIKTTLTIRNSLSCLSEGSICEERCQLQCTPDCDFSCCIPAHPSGNEPFAQETGTSGKTTFAPSWLNAEQCTSPCPSSCSPTCSHACCQESTNRIHEGLRPLDGQRKPMPYND